MLIAFHGVQSINSRRVFLVKNNLFFPAIIALLSYVVYLVYQISPDHFENSKRGKTLAATATDGPDSPPDKVISLRGKHCWVVLLLKFHNRLLEKLYIHQYYGVATLKLYIHQYYGVATLNLLLVVLMSLFWLLTEAFQDSPKTGRAHSKSLSGEVMARPRLRLPTMWMGAEFGCLYIHSAVSAWRSCLHAMKVLFHSWNTTSILNYQNAFVCAVYLAIA